MITDSFDSLIGTVLDEAYRLDALIGQDDSGAIFRATQLAEDRPVAVKLVPTPPDAGPDFAARFAGGAEAASKLTNANTVRLVGFGQTGDGAGYHVRELLAGLPLDALLDRDGALESIRAAHVGRQIAKALGDAHRAGVVHGDLSPASVFVCDPFDGEQDFVKVLDFGLPAAVGHRSGPRYLPPELVGEAEANASSDLYALGVLLHEMLTGRVPFEGDEEEVEIALRQLTEPLPPLHVPDVPLQVHEAWENLLDRLLAKRPEERPPSAQVVGDELRKIRELSRAASDMEAVDAWVTRSTSPADVEAALSARAREEVARGGLSAPLESPKPAAGKAPAERPERPKPAAAAPGPEAMPETNEESRGPGIWVVAAAALIIGAVVGIVALTGNGEEKAGPLDAGATPEVATAEVTTDAGAVAVAVADVAAAVATDAAETSDRGSDARDARDAGPDTAEAEVAGDALPDEVPADMVRLVIDSRPHGATVLRGRREAICETPCTVDVPYKKKREWFKLKLRGYELGRMRLKMVKGKIVKRKVRLEEKE